MHRFGITFHRNKRDKSTLKTELDVIVGIGKTSANKLLTHFKSVKKVKEANETELLQLINKKQSAAVLAYFNQQKTLV